MRTTSWVNRFLLGLVGAGVVASSAALTAQTYNVGDTVDDFELVNRVPFVNDAGQLVPKGAPLRLSDFEGKIVFMEWFYYW